jgi:prephenate dehydrogenase
MIGCVRIAILGFGLIGGSIARALRAPGAAASLGQPLELVAWSPTARGPRTALDAGILDAAPTDRADAIAGADLIVLAASPLACLGLVNELAGTLGEALGATTTVTDVASTKQMIVTAADAVGLRFVGGHPMAGREASGFGASSADLFVDRPWLICPGGSAEASDTARVEALARACRARPIAMDPTDHDRAVASISHLPLVLSAALVAAVAGDAGWPEARPLAAGGWQSMTRLAKGDPVMGAGIAATNGPAIAAGLRRVRDELTDWIAALDGDAGPLDFEARLRAARDRLGS